MENLFNANCVAKNKDGRLVYHRGTSSMREHLKRRHPATLDTCDASNKAKSKQHKIISYTRNLVCSSTRSIATTELIACACNNKGFKAC